MSQVIPFRPLPIPPAADIPALSARLIQVESAETGDEDLLDLLLEAEARTLQALADARAATMADAVLKLATVVRRATVLRPRRPVRPRLRRATAARPATVLRPGRASRCCAPPGGSVGRSPSWRPPSGPVTRTRRSRCWTGPATRSC